GAGPMMRNCIDAGVISPRFAGFEKNGNTSSMGAATGVDVVSTYVARGAAAGGVSSPGVFTASPRTTSRRAASRDRKPQTKPRDPDEAETPRNRRFHALARQHDDRGFAEDGAEHERRRRKNRRTAQRASESASKHAARDDVGRHRVDRAHISLVLKSSGDEID